MRTTTRRLLGFATAALFATTGCGDSTSGSDGGDAASGGEASVTRDAAPSDAAIKPGDDGPAIDAATVGDAAIVADLTVATLVQDLALPDLTVAPTMFAYRGRSGGTTVTVVLDHTGQKFTLTNVTMAWTATGTTLTLPSGALKLIVTGGCDGASCTPGAGGSKNATIGSTAHGLEHAGYYVRIQPDNNGAVGGVNTTGGNGFVALAQNTCTGGLGTYNAVSTDFNGGHDLTTSSSAYATAMLSAPTTAPSVTIGSFLLNGTAQGGMVVGTTCSLGVLTVSAADAGVNGTFNTSDNGVIAYDSPSDNSKRGAFGLLQSSIALSDLAGHTFVGLVDNYSASAASASSKSNFIQATVDATGANISIKNFTNVDTGVLDTTPTTGVIAALKDGLTTVTFTGTDGGKASGVLIAYKVGGQVSLAVVGQGGGSGSSDGGTGDGGSNGVSNFNAYLISQ